MHLQDQDSKTCAAHETAPTGASDRTVSWPRSLRALTGRLPPNTIGGLWILLAAFLFTIMTALIKLVGADLSVFQILAVRQAIMVLIVLPKIASGLPGSLASARPRLQAARVVFATTAMLCGFTALIELPLADATALSFSKTFFVTIFAIFLLGETVGVHRWGATIVGFLGVLLMLRPEGTGFVDPYALLAIAGAAAAGMVMVIIRILTRTDPPVTILTYQAVFVGLIMAVPAYLTWTPPTLNQWLLLIAIGIVSWAAQLSNIRAFRSGEATAIASLDYTRLLYATVFGVLIFSQWPKLETLAGAAVIICASIYTVRREAIRGRALARGPDGRGYNN
ncbi:drug/metabolite transporter (DMT)-like permease [Roseibium hamelinense]|uniref:Drug/metabolite transporter (DMT)-like permease n=1 Tax=Roseibium hamelinense TaxID=150831 RepID=A0A562T9R0_9HYPH|nr:DMT family transporter [Roseibium hamelinense]MTI45318.1 DMT family transporter [Roseibium hamelinense]TWI90315.1 drug/metabolite transporter (DMT)-like permease [Roseibium hamelinense]